MSKLAIRDLKMGHRGKEFELHITGRSTRKVGPHYVSTLEVVMGGKTYEMWEPANKEWAELSPEIGMKLVCKVVSVDGSEHIEPVNIVKENK